MDRGLGFPLGEVSVGGVSDGNFAAALDIPVLDGLGAVGDGAHARHEWVSLAAMIERAALTALLLGHLGENTLREVEPFYVGTRRR